jgi:exodeoxyribonuclease-1
VAPLAWHPDNRNAVIMVDLAGDISPLLELDSDTLRERLYTPKNELGDLPAVPVKLVHINKCPVLAQANTLRPEDADRLGINRQHCLDNLKVLRENPQVRKKWWLSSRTQNRLCRLKTSMHNSITASSAMPTAQP